MFEDLCARTRTREALQKLLQHQTGAHNCFFFPKSPFKNGDLDDNRIFFRDVVAFTKLATGSDFVKAFSFDMC
jgi:hypothetical protein